MTLDTHLAEIQKRAYEATPTTLRDGVVTKKDIPALIRVITKLREQRDNSAYTYFEGNRTHIEAAIEKLDAELLAELTRKDT